MSIQVRNMFEARARVNMDNDGRTVHVSGLVLAAPRFEPTNITQEMLDAAKAFHGTFFQYVGSRAFH